MSGTWTLSGDTVRFAQTADSFVRDWPFFARENQLVLDHKDAGGVFRTRVVLAK
jgi:hypothetical protein